MRRGACLTRSSLTMMALPLGVVWKAARRRRWSAGNPASFPLAHWPHLCKTGTQRAIASPRTAAAALSGFHPELQRPTTAVQELLLQVGPHASFQCHSSIAFLQEPLRQLVAALLSRPGGMTGVLVRRAAGPLRHGCSLKVRRARQPHRYPTCRRRPCSLRSTAAQPHQAPRPQRPRICCWCRSWWRGRAARRCRCCTASSSWRTHAWRVQQLQAEHLLQHLGKQGKLRAAEQPWEVQWRSGGARCGSTGIPAAEPRVSTCLPMWEVRPGPLEYVTRNVLPGGQAGLEAPGDSVEKFCARCDCIIGPGHCGGARCACLCARPCGTWRAPLALRRCPWRWAGPATAAAERARPGLSVRAQGAARAVEAAAWGRAAPAGAARDGALRPGRVCGGGHPQ
jgi:hypothetical protein